MEICFIDPKNVICIGTACKIQSSVMIYSTLSESHLSQLLRSLISLERCGYSKIDRNGQENDCRFSTHCIVFFNHLCTISQLRCDFQPPRCSCCYLLYLSENGNYISHISILACKINPTYKKNQINSTGIQFTILQTVFLMT